MSTSFDGQQQQLTEQPHQSRQIKTIKLNKNNNLSESDNKRENMQDEPELNETDNSNNRDGQWRAKIYELTLASNWEDRGTGYAEVQFVLVLFSC